MRLPVLGTQTSRRGAELVKTSQIKIVYPHLLELWFLNTEFLSVYSRKVENNEILMTAYYLHQHNYKKLISEIVTFFPISLSIFLSIHHSPTDSPLGYPCS